MASTLITAPRHDHNAALNVSRDHAN